MKWNPEADSHTHSQLNFSNGAETAKCGKGYSSTVRNSLIELLKSDTTLTSHYYKIYLKCIIALNVEIKTKKKNRKNVHDLGMVKCFF